VIGLVPAAGCGRKVTVTTGEIVLCTAGEILEDNTKQIEVPEDKAADYSVTTRVITCERHTDLAALYASAQKAIAEGDLVTARERLRTIVERDPGYGSASDQLAEIDAGRTPALDTGTPAPGSSETTSGATPPDSNEPIGPVANLAQYVPDAIPGYTAQGIVADVGSLTRQYLPTGKDADQLVIAVDQMADAATAASEAAAISTSYPKNVATKTIKGRTVTIGVNGQFVAAAAGDGAILVVVELHASGASAAGLVDAVVAVMTAVLP
jgi:hypothetical protein